MRVTALRAGTAVGARATARASGRRARGTGIGMASRRAVCERERAAARSTVRGSASSGARSAKREARNDVGEGYRFLLINTRFAPAS
jgi:hypothetical protein